MNELYLHLAILVLGVLISSFSQIILKKAAVDQKSGFAAYFLNLKVLSAYMLLFCATLLSVVALRVVPLVFSPIAEGLGQVFVLSLSFLLLGEKISKKKLCGVAVIITGIFIMMV